MIRNSEFGVRSSEFGIVILCEATPFGQGGFRAGDRKGRPYKGAGGRWRIRHCAGDEILRRCASQVDRGRLCEEFSVLSHFFGKKE